MYLVEEEKKSVMEILIEELNPKFVYIFSPPAKEESRTDGNIDLAIYTEDETDPFKLYTLGGYISMKLNKDVEIIDIRNTSTAFAAQIISSRSVLYCNDEHARKDFEIRAFNDYVNLKDERKKILESLISGGRVYGKEILIDKISIIERCLNRIEEEYENNPGNLEDCAKKDSIVFNIQRSMEAAIDIAMHIISEQRLGLPKSIREAFEMLNANILIDDNLLYRMNNMLEFINIAVPNYEKINMSALQNIIEEDLTGFDEFMEAVRNI